MKEFPSSMCSAASPCQVGERAGGGGGGGGALNSLLGASLSLMLPLSL